MKEPKAKTIKYQYDSNGNVVEDEYNWLRDSNWPKEVNNSDILDYLNAENEYCANYMQNHQALKDEIFKELEGRVKLADQSTYIKRGDYYYYSKTLEKADYQIYCRKYKSIEAEEEILLDVNKLAVGQAFTTIGSFAVSPNHKMLAYSVDYNGSERYQLVIVDIKSGKLLDQEIDNIIGSLIWREDNSGLFYTALDANWRSRELYFHKLGSKRASDLLIFKEENQEYIVNAFKSSSRQFLIISSGNHYTNAIYIVSMVDDANKCYKVKNFKDNVEYSLDHGDKFYLHTNEDAEDFALHIMQEFNFNEVSQEVEGKWVEYIAEKKGHSLASFAITAKYLLLNYQDNTQALPILVVKNLNNHQEQKLQFPDEAYSSSIYSTNYQEDDIRISYSSLARTNTVYSYDVIERHLDILKEQEIPSGFDPDEYKTRRIFAVSSDGAKVPISLVYKKSLFKADGSNPLYIYGYGSYGISMSPSFRNSVISLIDRGFVYAIAHIRGGMEKGRKWYEDAKFENKPRSFEDFIAVTKYLIDEKYSTKGNIAIMGGSAGGLLMGAVINSNPELYKLAIAHVPFVDALNTMLDASLPLTPGEYKEWGNPQEQKYFDAIKSYSPYDNVKTQHYPHLYVTAGLADPRVGYWEAAKWVAKLRANRLDKNVLLLKTNMEYGHRGGSGRSTALTEAAEDLAFILSIFDI